MSHAVCTVQCCLVCSAVCTVAVQWYTKHSKHSKVQSVPVQGEVESIRTTIKQKCVLQYGMAELILAYLNIRNIA